MSRAAPEGFIPSDLIRLPLIVGLLLVTITLDRFELIPPCLRRYARRGMP